MGIVCLIVKFVGTVCWYLPRTIWFKLPLLPTIPTIVRSADLGATRRLDAGFLSLGFILCKLRGLVIHRGFYSLSFWGFDSWGAGGN